MPNPEMADLTRQQLRVFESALQAEAGRAFLSNITELRRAYLEALSATDLSSPQGICSAASLQGSTRAIDLVFQSIDEMLKGVKDV